jgi:hypothetical protein
MLPTRVPRSCPVSPPRRCAAAAPGGSPRLSSPPPLFSSLTSCSCPPLVQTSFLAAKLLRRAAARRRVRDQLPALLAKLSAKPLAALRPVRERPPASSPSLSTAARHRPRSRAAVRPRSARYGARARQRCLPVCTLRGRQDARVIYLHSNTIPSTINVAASSPSQLCDQYYSGHRGTPAPTYIATPSRRRSTS